MKFSVLLFTLQCALQFPVGESFHGKSLPLNFVTVGQHTRWTVIRHEQDSCWPYSRLHMTEGTDDFWSGQKALMEEMTAKTEKSLRQEQRSKFADLQAALVGDTFFFSAMIFSLLWLACDNPFVPFSYLFGAIFGLAYAYGLGKYVETLGGTIEDTSSVQGAGVGQARFAFLILLFIFVGKLRMYGLIEIPSILGFFTYQLASLSQGLRESNN